MQCSICNLPLKNPARHHDHFRDEIICYLQEKLGTSNWQNELEKRHKHSSKYIFNLIETYQRFAPTKICQNCNCVDANLKQILGLPTFFTFSLEEIKKIIESDDGISNRKKQERQVASIIYQENIQSIRDKRRDVHKKIDLFLQNLDADQDF